jgi:hypothetical protein
MTYIQNLVNAYLENPPKIQYENVPFPTYQRQRIGLVTVKPKNTSYFKGIHTIQLTASLLDMAATEMPTEENQKIFKTRKL